MPATSEIGRTFQVRTLEKTQITPALRKKVIGAYQYITGIYSFLTPDIHLGAKREIGTPLSRTNYAEYEQTFNSVLLATLLNALVNGSMLYFGPPGSGKTTTPEVVGQVLFGLTIQQIQAATIYCHPNLTEEKMTGSFDIPKLMSGTKEVIWGTWVREFYRMLDEVNRMAPETSSILMQAVDRRRVSYAGEVLEMATGPIHATANYFDSGNFEMTPPFLDRFGISVNARGISPAHFDSLFMPPGKIDRTKFSFDQAAREEIYAEIQSIGIEGGTLSLLSHIASGLSSCHLAGNSWYDKNKSLFAENPGDCKADACGFDSARVLCSQAKEKGLTSRAVIALRDYSRALAWLLGRENVDNEVMQIVFGLVTAHRLSPTSKAMNGGESAAGTEFDKKLFARKTFDFPNHLFALGKASFDAQGEIYRAIDAFYDEIAQGTKSAKDVLIESEQLLIKVDAMEDPAKWDILQAVHFARQMVRAKEQDQG